MENKQKTVIENFIKNIEDKTFNVFFFVMDSKGAPLGSLAYIYETAKHLHDIGYTVKMLHNEDEFVGVESWMGAEYASLPHFNTEKDSVAITASDFLFIPEVYSGVMTKTKNLPCKRIAILQNFGYLTDTIPMGVSWDNLKMRDCVTTSESLRERLHSVFPEVNVDIVKPGIKSYFSYEHENTPKKLIINVVSKNPAEINSIIKPFYWKYPQYKWVAFRNVANVERTEFAKLLREGFATIWCDTATDFGYSALEAMAAGDIVIGKVPETAPEWMGKETLNNNGLWFYNDLDAQDAIATAIQMFLTSSSIPSELKENMEKTVSEYQMKDYFKTVEDVYANIFERRKKEFETILSIIKNKEKEENK